MTNRKYIPLKHRSIISVEGEDAINFLQGILTNDVNEIVEKKVVYSLMLTPQGKFLFDFFLIYHNKKIHIDCHKDSVPDILKKLKMYKLRSKVELQDLSDKYEVVALNCSFENLPLDKTKDAIYPFCKGAVYKDTRAQDMFARSFIEIENNYQSFKAHDFEASQIDDYTQKRIELKIPEGHIDLISSSSFPHDFQMNQYHAIDYKKGCYVGQEVTARVEYKSKKRKALYKIQLQDLDGNTNIAIGEEVYLDGKKVGNIYSCFKNYGLSVLDSFAVSKGQDGLSVNGLNLKITD